MARRRPCHVLQNGQTCSPRFAYHRHMLPLHNQPLRGVCVTPTRLMYPILPTRRGCPQLYSYRRTPAIVAKSCPQPYSRRKTLVFSIAHGYSPTEGFWLLIIRLLLPCPRSVLTAATAILPPRRRLPHMLPPAKLSPLGSSLAGTRYPPCPSCHC